MATTARPSSQSFNGAKFRAWRLKRSIGQDELARRMHYARSSISAFENGKRAPTRRFLELLQRIFDVQPQTFYIGVAATMLLIGACCSECDEFALLDHAFHGEHDCGEELQP